MIFRMVPLLRPGSLTRAGRSRPPLLDNPAQDSFADLRLPPGPTWRRPGDTECRQSAYRARCHRPALQGGFRSALPRFGRAAPPMAVADIDAALSFYTGVLGFHLTFTNGEPTHFAIVERDDAELHLTLAPEHRSDDVNVAHILVED